MRRFAAVLGTGLALVAPGLRAGEPLAPPLPVRIAYRADAACPSAEDFRAAVERRAPELTLAGPEEPAREFSADVHARPDGRVQGKLEISEPSGARATRRIEGDDCLEVSEALAFIVAELGRSLHIEPDTASAVTAPAAVAPIVVPDRRATPKATAARKPLRWEAGFGLEATRGPAPNWLIGPAVYLELGRARPPEPPFFSGRLSARYAKSGIIAGEIGDTELRWIAVRGELCGPRLHEGYLSLGACALFDAGELQGKGAGSADPKTRDSLWLAPGLLARAKATLAPALLVVGVEGGLFVPLIRPRFFYADADGEGEEVHEVPAVGSFVAVELGLLFP